MNKSNAELLDEAELFRGLDETRGMACIIELVLFVAMFFAFLVVVSVLALATRQIWG